MSDTMLDLRALASAHESISHPRGGLFPVQVTLPDGVIAVVSRGGAGHLGRAGRLDLTRSKDNGRTWSPPAVVVDSDEDDRNPAFGVAPDGTLVLGYMHQASYTSEGKYDPELRNSGVRVMRSADNRLSWSSPRTLDPSQFSLTSPFGRIVALRDGSIVMPVYSGKGNDTLPSGSFFTRSTDNGETWGAPELISEDMGETTLIELPSGDIVAAMREIERSHQRLYTSRSSDNGRSWTEPVRVTGDMRHPADLIHLTDGWLLMVYGNRSGPYRIEGMLSRDEGRSWEPALLALSGHLYGYDMPSPRPTDLGYPSGSLSRDGRTLVVTFYANPFPRCQDREWTGPWTTPFYIPEGYLGVTISVDIEELFEAASDHRSSPSNDRG